MRTSGLNALRVGVVSGEGLSVARRVLPCSKGGEIKISNR
jgi:hypothetical protein